MSKCLIIPASAKLNLYLHIKKKLPNGYHLLESFIIFINLFDTITINDSKQDSFKIKGTLANKLDKIITKEDNLVYKIINYIKEKYNINRNIKVTLNKNIPIGAGLAGGSADAAAILKALNIFWRLNLSINELNKIAIKFGADITSCIYSRSGLIEGIGERYSYIPLKFQLHILLLSNLPPLNTKEVYNKFKQQHIKKTTPFSLQNTYDKITFLNFIKKQSNDLTNSAIELLPSLQDILNNLKKTNPVIARMTGSGSSCFAIYSTNSDLLKAYSQMKTIYPNYLINKVTNLAN